jgi:hypothetical protein
MKRGDPTVRHARDVKLAVLDLVVRKNHFQKFRKYAGSLFEEQIPARRRRRDHDIAALFGLGTQVARENRVHGVHGLRAAAESQNGRIGLCRIVAIRKDDLVNNGRIGDVFGMRLHFRPGRLDYEHHNGRHRGGRHHGSQLLPHRESPQIIKLPTAATGIKQA